MSLIRVEMSRAPEELLKRIEGPVWEGIRDKFLGMVELLFDPSPETHLSLSTVYIVFCTDASEEAPPYAVVWMKNSKKWVVGLALPEEEESPWFVPKPKGKGYRGVTKYIEITPYDEIPEEFEGWAKAAYENALNQ